MAMSVIGPRPGGNQEKRGAIRLPFFYHVRIAYCFLSSMLPFTALALMSRPPLPIVPEA
jgi:hypothetical protein